MVKRRVVVSNRHEGGRPRVRDCIQPGVNVLFVGINPGLRSAATGHHFAGYSNRFWKLLHEAGLVPEPITYQDDRRLPEWGFGITNIVPRATAGIDELTREEYQVGARALLEKIRRYQPRVLAPVGVTVWRALLEALGETERRRQPVTLGFQPIVVEGARVVVLPNPSGRNATVTRDRMLDAFRAVAAERRRLGSFSASSAATTSHPSTRTRAAGPRTRRPP